MDIILFIISFLFVFGLVVIIHELGHFLAAKKAGLDVEEFGFGYPPRIFGKKIGSTIYSINWIPFGGFVKILGEGGEESKSSKSLASQSSLTKVKVIGAGVFMNFILTIVILSGLYAFGFQPLIPDMDKQLGVSNKVYLEEVSENTPAYKAGLLPKDQLLKINNDKIENLDDFSEKISKNLNQEVEIVAKRGSKELLFKLAPYQEQISGQDVIRIGVSITQITMADNIFMSFVAGFLETLRLGYLTIAGILTFFANIFTKLTIGQDAVGPVGLAVITNEIRQLGFSYLMQFVAILSISLAIFNLLPIPALDGGHIFMLLLEKIKGGKISDKLKNKVTIIGFSFLIFLMLAITAQDFIRFNLISSIKNLFGM